MNKYDLVSIVRPTADDTVVESIHKSIADVVSSGGGSPVSYTHLRAHET